MSFLGKLFKRSQAEQLPEPTGSNRVFLQVTDLGWQARLIDPAAPDKKDIRQGGAETLTDRGEARIETLMRMAAQEFPPRDLRRIAHINILIDDPHVFYTDTKAEIFSAASAATLRDFGAQNLNCDKVTYGQASFGTGPAGPRTTGVIGYADMKRLGNYLTRLDKMAGRVSTITPLADVLVRRAAAGSTVYGGLYIGGYHSQIVLANPVHGAVLVRAIPVGIMTLIEKLAEGNGITPAEAARSIQERDLMADLRLGGAELGGDVMTQSAADRVLGPSIRQLLEEIADTLAFFETQRIAGRPASLELFGDTARIKGLDDILRQYLPVPALPHSASLFEVFASLPPRENLNLLAQAGAELRIGSVTYGYKNERLQPASVIAREEAATRLTEPSRPAPVTQRRRPGAGRRGQSGRRGGGESGGGLSFLSGLFKSKSNDDGASPDQGVAEQERQYFMVLGLLVVAVFYLLYQQYDGVAATHQNAMLSLSQTITTNTAQRQKASQVKHRPVNTAIDKVLWTEKFLVLGGQMNETMWLTDVYLDAQPQSVGAAKVLSKRLVLQGAVLPSTDGHVLQIAEYIRRLESDATSFMSDFREITFHGAHIDSAETDPVVRFIVDAWYDENKRLETKEKADGSLGSTMQAVGRRNKETQDMVPAIAQSGR